MIDWTEFYCRVWLALKQAGRTNDAADGIMERRIDRVAAGFALRMETPEQVAQAILMQEENDDE